MDFKHQGVRQRANVMETLLGTVLIRSGYSRLADRSGNSTQHYEHNESGSGNSQLVTDSELSCAISPRVSPDSNGKTFQMTADVFRELFYRPISPVWFLTKCMQNYSVEISCQAAAQLVRITERIVLSAIVG
jgi:hypothetical protein